MNRIENYVVTWDFSDLSRAALSYALKRFKGNAIRVLTVLERPNPYSPGVSFDPKAEEKAATESERQFYEELVVPDDCGVSFEVLFGEPAEQICRFVEQTMPDYLVMSTHGRTGINKMILGSVAQSVIANTTVPMILLPPNWFNSHNPNRENVVMAEVAKKTKSNL